MAKKRSSKSTYPSRYGGGHVTIAQYITEYLCENVARSKKQDLPVQFWENKEWAKFFKWQITMLNRHLLKEYHPRAIVKALKDPRCKFVNSFAGFMKVEKWIKVLKELDGVCKAEDERDKNLKPVEAVDARRSKPATREGSKHIFNKLRELDNGKESEATK